MFDLTRQERKALLFIVIFIATGAVLKVLPFAIAEHKPFDTSEVSNGLKDESPQVNINTAEVEDLTKLYGVGSSIALRIIDYRQKQGFFKSIDDLLAVKGIGQTKFDKIKDDITIE